MKHLIQRVWNDLDDQFAKVEHLLIKSEDLVYHRQNGAWSALDTLTHLYLTEKYALQYIKYKEQKKGPEKKGRFQSWRSWFLKRYLSSRLKFKAPTIVDPRNLPNEERYQSIESLLSDYRELRSIMKDFLEAKDEDWLDQGVFKHPISGRITALEMLKFFKRHFHRHADQIRRTVATASDV